MYIVGRNRLLALIIEITYIPSNTEEEILVLLIIIKLSTSTVDLLVT